LTFTPIYDSSITGDINGATIQNTIQGALNIYSSLFSDSINVRIYFQEGGGLGSSQFNFSNITYSSYRTAMVGDSTSADDSLALSTSLPNQATNPANGATNISIKPANARAIGLSFTPSLSSGSNLNLDGIITLNTSLMNLDRIGPQDGSKYDLQAVVMHEIDEVLGLGSGLNILTNPAPEDMFRYTSAGTQTRTYTTANGNDAWFSVDGLTNLVQFHNVANCNAGAGDCGDWENSATVRVQDQAGTPGTQPNLSPEEIRALDAIGYTLITVPEPGTVALMGLAALAGLAMRRRLVSGEPGPRS